MGGRIAFPLYSLYHATKWAIEGFSESLQYELSPFGIRVKIIEPGPIKTDFYDRSMDVMSREGLVAYDHYVSKAMPNMQRAGASAPGPDVVANAIFHAASDLTSRLRYAPNARGILALRRLLPDGLFRALVAKTVGVS
jgi:short-subunit dehydrogenase